MTCVRPSCAPVPVAILLAAVALAAGCARGGAAPRATTPTAGTSAVEGKTTARAASTPAGTGVLVLDGKTFKFEVRRLAMGDDVLVAAKAGTGDKGSVDVEGGKVRYADFTVEGAKWMWEPTSTGGAPEPSIAKEGKTYTVTGGVHQLDDYKKLADYTFTATCPN